MKFGLCTFLKDLDTACEIGYDYLVLSGAEVSALDDEAFAELAERIRKSGIPVTALNAICPPAVDICGPAYDEAAAKTYMNRLAERGTELGVKILGVGAPNSRKIPAGFSIEQARINGKAFYRLGIDIAAEYGMEIAMEALAPSYCDFVNTLEESWELAEAADPGQGRIIIDFFHMEAGGDEPEAAAPYLPCASDIHISGIDDRLPKPGRPFVSEADEKRLNKIAGVLEQNGYDKTIALEPDPVESGFVEKARSSLRIMRGIFL